MPIPFLGPPGPVTQADWVRTNQLKNAGLFGRFFERFPTGGDARHKGIARLAPRPALPAGS